MCHLVILFALGLPLAVSRAAVISQEPDQAAQQAAGIVAGLEQGDVGKIVLNEKTERLEVRDDSGVLLEEILSGTTGRAVDVGGQEYRLSFGKDDMGRKSVLVKAGPAMRKPITIDVFGRRAVLSPEASLLATLSTKGKVILEPSLCGQVYYIENSEYAGGRVKRLASSKREMAVLAKPSNPTGAGPGTIASGQDDSKTMEEATDAVKSVFCAVLGLPDKQPTSKAKVYRLRGNTTGETPPGVAAPASAEAGRP
jgi:hypothetical protein